jgi:hypothetical protein
MGRPSCHFRFRATKFIFIFWKRKHCGHQSTKQPQYHYYINVHRDFTMQFDKWPPLRKFCEQKFKSLSLLSLLHNVFYLLNGILILVMFSCGTQQWYVLNLGWLLAEKWYSWNWTHFHTCFKIMKFRIVSTP